MTQDDGHDDVEFAQRALDLLEKIASGESSPEEDRDVRRVAVGLHFTIKAVRHYSRAMSLVAASDRTGANEALDMLAAIKTGEQNPVWKYLKGIRSDPKRAKRAAKASGGQNQRRYIIIGCVRAYRDAADCSEAKAYRDIARECSLPDMAFNADRIKGWLKRYRDDLDNWEAHQKAIAGWAQLVTLIAARADPNKPPAAVLEAAKKLVGQTWAVPYV
jgi:hypothetical protein